MELFAIAWVRDVRGIFPCNEVGEEWDVAKSEKLLMEKHTQECLTDKMWASEKEISQECFQTVGMSNWKKWVLCLLKMEKTR